MREVSKENRKEKRFHVYKLDRNGKKCEHLAWVYADSFPDAVKKAEMFFLGICKYGIEVVTAKPTNKLN